MLAGGTDAMYRAALAAPHRAYARVDVWREGVRVYEGLPFEDGQVSATLALRTSRELSLSLHESWFPWEDADLLAPMGNEIRAYRGIVWPNGEPLYWPVFVGKITTAELSGGAVDLTATDRAAQVVDNKFETPQSSVIGEPVGDEVRRVIRNRLAGATFGAFDDYVERVPLLTWENDPGQALDEMATAVGSFWYPLADGDFVLRRYPWTIRRPSVITLADGDGGTVLGSQFGRARDRIYNVVTVTGERADGETPVHATDADDDPTSATYVDGPFGRRGLLRRLNTPTSDEAAQGAARAMRRRTTAATLACRLSVVPDAALELGDVASLNVRGRRGIIQVVSDFDLPLGAGDMTVVTRSQVVDLLEDE